MDRILECYEGEFGSDRVVAEARERVDWLIEHAGQGPVLDIGCSQGLVGLLLAREGIECLGIDSDPDAIAFARNRLSRESERISALVDFREEAADNILKQDISRFRTIILSLVLDQITDPAEFLSLLAESLHEDASVLIQVSLGVRGTALAWYPRSLLQLLEQSLVVTSIERVGERLAVIASARSVDDKEYYVVNEELCDFIESCFEFKDRLLTDELVELRRYFNDIKSATSKEAETDGDDADWRKLAIERRWSLVNAKKQNEILRQEISLVREKMEAKQEMILNLQEKLTAYRHGDEND